MKNPLVKQDNSLLFAGIAIGTLAAGAITYVLLSDNASGIRTFVTDQLSSLIDKISGSGKEEEEAEEHSSHEYNHPKHKAPKTDREALLKDMIITHHDA